MLFLTKIIIRNQYLYDDIQDILVRLWWGFLLPMNQKPSFGYFIDRKFTRTLL
jgi:hypothetical protein